MLAKVKTALRISHSALDDELEDLILGARQDLKLSGVSNEKADAETDIDPLIIRAVVTYCKANFGLDNKDSDKYQQSYNMLKNHLTLSTEYQQVSSDV